MIPRLEPTTSALKALAILEGVVYGDGPVSIARLAEALGMAKPTAHRIAVSLEHFSRLRTDRPVAARRRYPEVSLLGSVRASPNTVEQEVVAIGRPHRLLRCQKAWLDLS